MEEVDWSVGSILQTLEENKLLENTLVIFTSDNGPWLTFGNHAGNTAGLREGKGTAWDGGVKVPCIMSWKGVLPAGVVNNQLATTMEILPTIASLCGAPSPSQKIDGINIAAHLVGKTRNWEDPSLYTTMTRTTSKPSEIIASSWFSLQLLKPMVLPHCLVYTDSPAGMAPIQLNSLYMICGQTPEKTGMYSNSIRKRLKN